MPSRIAQTICSALFLIILYFVDKTTLSSLWILIPAGILVAAAFTLGTLVNTFWHAKFPPKLDAYETNWVKRFVLFIHSMDEHSKDIFCSQLAQELWEKEFNSMAEKDLPEELKLMALAPAVRLKLIHTDKLAAHYKKIIFYHHAFASPDQPYRHICETQHEDGLIILASDALEAAYLKPENYFNTALYEWCCIFVRLHKLNESFEIETENAWIIINTVISTETNKLLIYLGQPSADIYALLCYCYVMYPEKLKMQLPEFYLQMKNLID